MMYVLPENPYQVSIKYIYAILLRLFKVHQKDKAPLTAFIKLWKFNWDVTPHQIFHECNFSLFLFVSVTLYLPSSLSTFIERGVLICFGFSFVVDGHLKCWNVQIRAEDCDSGKRNPRFVCLFLLLILLLILTKWIRWTPAKCLVSLVLWANTV